MTLEMPEIRSFIKPVLCVTTAIGLSMSLASCSTNPATGEQQFAGLMSQQQEVQVGSQEHAKIAQSMKLSKPGEPLHDYVNAIGQNIAAKTERPDVNYQFFVVDDAMVNAFALPGGYIYVTRGLLAHANSEAELAAVIAHEIAHVTGRHSAERYSHSVITSLGATVLSAVLDSGAASQALGLGSNLYLSSYSRSQEREADALGVRYLYRSGYETDAMASFLSNLRASSELEARLAGRNGEGFSYFSTHPQTGERVSDTLEISRTYPENDSVVNRSDYLKRIDGMIFGDSPEQGFVRENTFYHPEMNFTFTVPEGFRIINRPSQVIATNNQGSAIIFDVDSNKNNVNASDYLTKVWLNNEPITNVERIEINGKPAATASFEGRINNQRARIQVVAVEWSPNTFYRFQIAMPSNASRALVDDLKRTTYSLRTMTAAEKKDVKPYRIRIITARSGDTVASLARRMPVSQLQEEHFRVLNGMSPAQEVQSGHLYKIISSQ